MEKYKLTDEHNALLKPWADKWIANAMSTRTIEENEKPLIKKYVKELYQSANLTPPPDNRIIFVDSPFVARFAGGFAAWIWYCRTKESTYAATESATE